MFVSHDYTRLRAVRPRVLGAECKSVLKCRFWNTLSKPELSSSGVLGCTVLVRWQGTITFPTAARARLESSVFRVRTCRGEKSIIIKPGGQNSLRLHPHDVCVVLISSPRWREGVLYDAIVFETCDQWNASGLTELHRGKVKCIIGCFCFFQHSELLCGQKKVTLQAVMVADDLRKERHWPEDSSYSEDEKNYSNKL